MNKKIVATKMAKGYYPNVRSRHTTHDPLRTELPRMPFRSIIRFGSDTEINDGKQRVEINTVIACQTSADKQLMKQAFEMAEVITPIWCGLGSPRNISDIGFPLVAKHRFGSRGTGNTLLNTEQEYTTWRSGKDIGNYIFEKFHNYNREYRLHVTADGCFYTCRKMLRENTPLADRWYRNDSNSAWIVEENEQFDKPTNWNEIVAESVKAMKAVGLDFAAVDVRVQSSVTPVKGKIRTAPKFIIIETNSAPSFGTRTLEEYKKIIPQLLKKKYINS